MFEVPAEQLKDMLAARTLVKEMLHGKEVKTLQDMTNIIEGARDAVCQLDRSFRLELAILSSADETLTEAVCEKVLLLLLTNTRHVTLQQAATGLTSLRASRMVSAASFKAQGLVDSVSDVVANMLNAVSPNPQIAAQGGFFEKVLHQLQFFLCYEPTRGDDGDEQQPLYGIDALNCQWTDVSRRMATPKPSINLAQLEVFQRFKWLLTSDQVKELSVWVKTVLGTTNVASSGAASSSSSSQKAPKKTTSKVELKQHESKSSVLQFFG